MERENWKARQNLTALTEVPTTQLFSVCIYWRKLVPAIAFDKRAANRRHVASNLH